MPIPDQDAGPLPQGQTMASLLCKAYAEAVTLGYSCARVFFCLPLDRRGFMLLQLRRRRWSGRQAEGRSKHFRLHSVHCCSICPATACLGTGKLKWGTHFPTRRRVPLHRNRGQSMCSRARFWPDDTRIQLRLLYSAPWAVSQDVLHRLPSCAFRADSAAAHGESPRPIVLGLRGTRGVYVAFPAGCFSGKPFCTARMVAPKHLKLDLSNGYNDTKPLSNVRAPRLWGLRGLS